MDITSQANITVATDLPPIVTNSSVECANLNANLLQGNAASAFAAASHDHAASDIWNSSEAGRALLTADEYTDQLDLLGLTGDSPTTIDSPARLSILVNSGGLNLATRHALMLTAGAGISMSFSDNAGPGTDYVEVTISSTVTGGGNGDNRHTEHTSADYTWPTTGGIVICNSAVLTQIDLYPPASPANGTIITAIMDGAPAGASPIVHLPGGGVESLDNASAIKTWVYSSLTDNWHKIVDID